MPKIAWYPFYPADYLCDTVSLTLEEDGAYRRLLDWYWLHGPIPNNAKKMQEIFRISSKKTQKIFRVLLPFFVEKNGFLHQARMDAEIAKATEKYEQRLAAGKLGVLARAKPNGQPYELPNGQPNGSIRARVLQPQPQDLRSSLPTSSAEKKSIQEKIRPFSDKNGHECFDEFWKRYPRKEGKKRALEVWTRKKLESREKATPIIVDVVTRTRDHQPWIDGTPPTPAPT